MAALLAITLVFGPVVAWLIWRSPGYKRVLLDQPPGPGWTATAEAFVDPSSGDVAQVWVDPASGRRAYVRRGHAGQVD